MKILFTICGRAGSKGIKNKNIRDFVERPLPYYSLSAIDLYLKKNAGTQYDIVVSTDSEVLLDMMRSNSMRSVELIKREESLSGDTTGKIDVIRNCMYIMKERKGEDYDMVVDLDITSPLRRIRDIELLIETHTNKKPDVTVSAVPARRNPYFNQLMRGEHGMTTVIRSNYTARQQAPEVFDMNASLYAYSPSHLVSGRRVLDGYCEMIEMPDTGVLDLDHENDFEIMQLSARYLFQTNTEYAEIRDNIK